MGVEKGSEESLDSNSNREKCVGFGIGASKKEGQQNAAKMALILYGYLKDDQFDNSDIFYPDWERIDRCLEDENENYLYQNDSGDNSSDKESIKDKVKSTKNNINKFPVDNNNFLLKLENEKELNCDSDVMSNLSDETDSD